MASTNTEHTPMRQHGTIVHFADGGFDVCNCPNPEALAALIVRACNSHDQLVAALKAEHQAADWLMARLIELDPEFRPTKSPVWAAIEAGHDALKAAGVANTRYFNPESLKAAGQRFLLGPDGVGAAWVHPLELTNPRYEGWTDCTDMSDELFQRLIAERQHNTRLAALALPGA